MTGVEVLVFFGGYIVGSGLVMAALFIWGEPLLDWCDRMIDRWSAWRSKS